MSNFTKTKAGREARPAQRFFTPVQVGPFTLTHRMVMAPLTRSRSEQPGDIAGDLMLEYYRQRASEGGLIISAATSISIAGRGWLGAPGMYSDEQVAGWKRITSAVHAKGGHIFSQLWHEGRSSHVSMINGAAPVAASVDTQYCSIPRSTLLPPMAGRSPRRIGCSISRKSQVLSRTIGKPPSAQKPQALTVRNFTLPTVIWRINSSRTAATSARTVMGLNRKPNSFPSLEFCTFWVG
jgi:hypothetical protein